METDSTARAATAGPGTGSRRGALVLLGVSGLIVAVFVGWLIVAGAWRGEVAVAWGASARADAAPGAPSCRDAVLPTRRLRPGVREPVIPARPGMDCRLPVAVTNNGPVTVRLETLVLQYMGRDAGAEIQVRDLEGLPRDPEHSERGLHASFAVDRDLAPGDTYRFVVRFTHRDDGCSAATTWMGGFPKVVVSALGVSGEISSGRTLAFRGTGTAAGCSE